MTIWKSGGSKRRRGGTADPAMSLEDQDGENADDGGPPDEGGGDAADVREIVAALEKEAERDGCAKPDDAPADEGVLSGNSDYDGLADSLFGSDSSPSSDDHSVGDRGLFSDDDVDVQ
eukprot:7719397-Pyramimonas_sp.AAC.1